MLHAIIRPTLGHQAGGTPSAKVKKKQGEIIKAIDLTLRQSQ